MAKLIVSDVDVKDKKVLVRVDFNVPIKDGVIGDDNRIVAALPTIKYIIENGGKAILLSHLGRIKSDEDKKSLSLAPVAKRLSELLEKPVTFVPSNEGKEVEDAINNMKDGDLVVLENTRFQDIDNDFGKRESKNDPKLGEYWASLGDVFVNDAFGTAHRSHASNVGIATAMKAAGKPAAAGFLLEKEIKFLGNAVANPVHPFVTILGGAKVSDKIGVITNLIPKADHIIIGGGMAYTFLKAQGHKIGKSLVEDDKVEFAKELLEKAGDKLVLPKDFYKTKDIHVHFPEGAIPKDGPSAGITICTAMVSALTGARVRRDIAMTGEISIRGRVLPIGGLKEKTMAALRHGIKTVIIPEGNAKDLEEIDQTVRRALNFLTVSHVDSVLEAALDFQPLPEASAPVQVPQEAQLAVAREQNKSRNTGIRQ